MGFFNSLEELIKKITDYNDYTHTLSTIVTLFGFLLIIYAILASLYHIIQLLRLYVFAQLSCCKASYAKRYGKWAVVTGATDGIGLEMAKELAKRGQSVIIVGRNEHKLENCKQQIEQEASDNVEVLTVKVDFSDSSLENYKSAKELINRDNREIGLLINNAGMLPEDMKNFDQFDDHVHLHTVNVNILGMLHFTKMILPGMIERGRGCIMNVSSLLGCLPAPFMNVYGPSKTFVDRFTLNLQHEYKGFPIDIILLTPSVIQTKLFQNISDNKFTHRANLMAPTPKYFATTTINAISTRISRFCGCFGHSLTKAIFDSQYHDFMKNFWLQLSNRLSSKYQPSKYVPKKENKNEDQPQSSVDIA